MKCNFDQIAQFATGTVCVTEENGKIYFDRFTKEQLALYKIHSAEENRPYYDRCLCSAGVTLSFRTNSRTLKLSGETVPFTSRKFYSFDVFANGKMIGAADNIEGEDLPKNFTEVVLPTGAFEKTFRLGEGEKDVRIYFPFSMRPGIRALELDDGASAVPVKRKKLLLAFGDSITQGYDALRPSHRYPARLAEMLGAEELNKGIGGEIFFPALAQTKDDLCPDYITVAYGTNDFGIKTEPDFRLRCEAFFKALSQNYPNSKIFAVTPIWRKDYAGPRAFGAFEKVEEGIREATAGLGNVTTIRGFDFVPKDENYFSDLRLHPRDEGFKYYADNLYSEIKKYLI